MPDHDDNTETTTDETVDEDAPTDAAAGTDGATDATPDSFPREYVQQLREENARYRQRAGRADELHRRLTETTIRSAAAGYLADPGDLAMFTEESDLVDDDGYPDADKIITAAKALVAQRPHLAPRRPHGDIGQGATPTGNPSDLAGILRARAS